MVKQPPKERDNIETIYEGARIGDAVQVDWFDGEKFSIHTGLVTMRVGCQYRVRFENGATLLVRPCDIVSNLSKRKASPQ